MPVLFIFAMSAPALATADFRVSGDIYTSISGQNSVSRGVYDRSGFFQAGDGVTYDNTDLAPDFSYHIQSSALADVGGCVPTPPGRSSRTSPERVAATISALAPAGRRLPHTTTWSSAVRPERSARR